MVFAACGVLGAAGDPFLKSELIFPLEHWHNHSSSIVEMPGGGFCVCWFHGSGERQSDDVVIMGARWHPSTGRWSEPFLLADTPNFPDTNPVVFIDARQRLWLSWVAIVANEWHTAILKYKIASDYQQIEGPPRWEESDSILLNHDLERFEKKVRAVAEPDLEKTTDPRRRERLEQLIGHAGDKYFSRMGWMPRTHIKTLPSGRIIFPLYSDGYSFGLMALSDDGGKTWKPSEPLVGYGSIQPSVVWRNDGTLVAYMRDNGPPPKRIHMSTSPDNGETWTRLADTDFPNPGSSVEALTLANGHWVLVYNDTERGRHSLALSLSDDEGKTWKWKRHIELDNRGDAAASYHYPSIIQARDGTIHLTYSYFLNHVPKDSPHKAIKHAQFNEEWIRQGGE